MSRFLAEGKEPHAINQPQRSVTHDPQYGCKRERDDGKEDKANTKKQKKERKERKRKENKEKKGNNEEQKGKRGKNEKGGQEDMFEATVAEAEIDDYDAFIYRISDSIYLAVPCRDLSN